MPTVKGTLLMAEACTYDDRELASNKQKLLDSKGIVFTHSDVSKDLAKHFKVPPVTSKIARPKGLKIKCEKAGQSIELTRRIGNIIKDYEDSIDVFKELIQNADDAGATEVKFLIDWRQHDVDQLFDKEMHTGKAQHCMPTTTVCIHLQTLRTFAKLKQVQSWQTLPRLADLVWDFAVFIS